MQELGVVQIHGLFLSLAHAQRSVVALGRTYREGRVGVDIVFAESGQARWEAHIVLKVGNGQRLLMLPDPSADALTHRKSVRFPGVFARFPEMIEHAVLARIMEGKVYEIAIGQLLQARSQIVEQFQ